jgi:hypothetical protein
MNINRVRPIAVIFIFTLMSGCVGYSYPYSQGNAYGHGARGGYGYSNYQAYRPYRGRNEYHERGEYGQRGGGYGQYRQRHDDD